MLFPLVLGAFGIIASMIGVLSIRAGGVIEPDAGNEQDAGNVAMHQLNVGYYITCAISVVGIFAGSFLLLRSGNVTGNYGIAPWVWYSFSGCVGILLSIAFVFITQYYTSGTWRPVREIAESSVTGPATNILSGVTVGLECVVMPVLAICVALGLSYFLGSQVHIPYALEAQGIINVNGIFGTAAATVGMLMSCAYILTMDTFGPITDNAGGISEMGGQVESVRNVTDALDSVGNTTKALTKGYAVGSAALAAFLLFSAYLDVLYSFKHNPAVYTVDLANIVTFIAALIGVTLIFFFSSLAIRAVRTAAMKMIEEVRRQFKAQPNIMAEKPEDRVDPDYARCVDISTEGALRAMLFPGAIAVLTPIAVGVILGPQAAAGLLMVGTMGGVIMALFLNNSGGAWDNAKKYIEAGFLRVDVKGQVVDYTNPEGIVLGKKSEAHKASVIGDTVGDPFKDTAGPSLHVLIKLLSTITLVLAPLYVFLHP
jgi:K(+)-stimulated pyrophosphate-energized sodium pump